MKKTFIIIFCALLAISCKKRIQIPVDADKNFKEYISAYTSGIISKSDAIKIFFKDSTVINEDPNFLKECLEVTPSFEYTLEFQSGNYLYIKPNENLPSGERFEVLVDMKKLTGKELVEDHFPLVFETKNQDFTISDLASEIQDVKQSGIVKIKGIIETEDVAKLEDVQQILSKVSEVDVKKAKWRGLSPRRFEFQFFNIKKSEVLRNITFNVNGKGIGVSKKLKETVSIPSLGDFRMTGWKYFSYPDQILRLTFTDPVNKKQDLDGLIKVDQFSKLKYAINGNDIDIFLNNSYTGNTTVVAYQGVTNIFGARLKAKQELDVVIDEPLPTVEMIGSGTILPNSQGLIIPFKTIGLKKVDVDVFKIHEKNVLQFLQVNNLDGRDELRRVGEIVKSKTIDLERGNKKKLKQWLTHGLNLRDLIAPEPGAIYRVRFSFKQAYTFCECDEDVNASYYSNNYDYYENSTIQRRNNSDVCERSFYYRSTRSKNLLASDLGLIAKGGDNNHFTIVTTDLIQGKASVNTLLKFYNFQQRQIASGRSNEEGILSIKLDEKPQVIIAEKNQQKAYLKMESSYSKSTSKFNTNGVTRGNGVDAFFYGERGVWRPGDDIFLSLIVNDEYGTMKNGMPMKIKFSDPKGRVVSTQKMDLTTRGIHSIKLKTDIDAPTGNYTVEAVVGSHEFEKSLKIETVRPNRLKIHFNPENDEILGSKTQKFDFSSAWLHGATAGNLKANVKMVLSPIYTSFKNFKGYDFEDITRTFEQSESVIFSDTLDKNGDATITLKPKGIRSKGKLRASFVSKVFEKGGGFSIDNFTTTYHPYSTYVGMDIHESSYGHLPTNRKNKIDLICVNPEGKLSSKKDSLRVRIYKIEWRWWWQHNHRDVAGYIANNSYNIYKDTTVYTKNGRASFDFSVDEDEWGQYYIQAANGTNHRTGQVVFVDYPNSYRNTNEQNNALLLNMKSDKTKYQVGETAKLTIPTASAGRALISIENDVEVVKTYWINTNKGTTSLSIPLDKSMSPNCYVHITTLQKHLHEKNDKPLRMYGVIPITVFDKNTVLQPEISMKEEIRPEEFASISVSEESGRGMHYTVAIVDEGLLDLTRFRTPKVWEHFNKKRALGIKTWDIYDDVINSFSGKFDNVYRIGGDGSGSGGNIAKAQRFIPAVRYLGPFYLKPGEKANHKFKITNYVGSVRAMVVARNGQSFGKTDKTVKVRKPLMIHGNAPRTFTPGDEVEIPLTIFANEKAKLPIKIQVSNSNLLSLSNKSITIDKVENGEALVFVKATVKEKLGNAKITINASCLNDKHSQSFTVPVRMPGYEVTDVFDAVVEPGKSMSHTFKKLGWENTNEAVVEVSQYPSINLEKRLRYLIQYPHGCIEQTTSSVFPQLFLSQLMELSQEDQKKIDRNIEKGIKRIQKFQTMSGGFAYWPGGRDASEWGSNYAGHFLLEAKERGYYVPQYLLDKWSSYQNQKVNEYGTNTYNGYRRKANEHTQAYRLYTLAMNGEKLIGAMNRLKESGLTDLTAKYRLAAAYSIAGRKSTAKELTEGLSHKVSYYRDDYYTFGSDVRDKAVIIESMHYLNNTSVLPQKLKDLAKDLGSERWLSTQETAYALCAFAKVIGNKARKAAKFILNKNGKKETLSFNDMILLSPYKSLKDNNSMEIKNLGSQPLFVRVLNAGTPPSTTLQNKNSGLAVTVTYKTMDGIVVDGKNLEFGKDYSLNVFVKNHDTKEKVNNIALSTFYPAGCELQIDRMIEGGNKNPATYEDIKDDKVYSYFNLPVLGSAEFKYTFTASFKGKYISPGVHCEAMYDASKFALVKGRMIEIR